MKNIPQGIKPVDHLTDILGIGRGSAYRRLNNEKFFTFDEIAKLALKLDFSIDEIIRGNIEEQISSELQVMMSLSPEENFLAMIMEYYKWIERISQAKNAVIISVKRLDSMFTTQFETLTKFLYFRWMHRSHKTTINSSFSDTVLPSEIIDIHKKINSRINLINEITVILNRDILLNLIREVRYYYNRKLISEEEVMLLKNDLTEYVNFFEKVMQKNVNESGPTYYFYLSLLDIESNCICAKFNEKMVSQYCISAIKSTVITDQNVCKIQQQWLESLKKYSVLITQSNEILQAIFLKKQQEYIESITSDLLYTWNSHPKDASKHPNTIQLPSNFLKTKYDIDNFRKIIVEKLKEKIPPNTKPINYLANLLNISKESLYRRFRGDISFTLEEMTKLSVELKISLDELIRTGRGIHT
ncbi:MAG: helix-turn-helix domain containing protein [Dysgonamonadaceae bacterium]|nr:helix-turn-helix domain containing protein [Dysgonamonadaceae bacterium]